MDGPCKTPLHELLASCAASVHAASKAHLDAAMVASEARSRETAALNHLNAAQRNLDKVLADLKKEAPRDSDWKVSERRGVSVG